MKVLYGAVEVERSRDTHFTSIFVLYTRTTRIIINLSFIVFWLAKCFEMRVQCSKINKK